MCDIFHTSLILWSNSMHFKIGVVLVGTFAVFVVFSAIYAHISYTLMKIDEERDL